MAMMDLRVVQQKVASRTSLDGSTNANASIVSSSKPPIPSLHESRMPEDSDGEGQIGIEV